MATLAFRLKPGDRVSVDTGVTITTRAGQVQFREPVNLGPLRLGVTDTLFVLAYLGEGLATVWFRGQLLRDADLSRVVNAVCHSEPSRCNGDVLVEPENEWWVRIRSSSGQTGWTKELDKFRRNAWRRGR